MAAVTPSICPESRTRIARVATPNPSFTDGTPNATYPWKQDYARRYGPTNWAAIRSNPKI